jgi:hypothetical protein
MHIKALLDGVPACDHGKVLAWTKDFDEEGQRDIDSRGWEALVRTLVAGDDRPVGHGAGEAIVFTEALATAFISLVSQRQRNHEWALATILLLTRWIGDAPKRFQAFLWGRVATAMQALSWSTDVNENIARAACQHLVDQAFDNAEDRPFLSFAPRISSAPASRKRAAPDDVG